MKDFSPHLSDLLGREDRPALAAGSRVSTRRIHLRRARAHLRGLPLKLLLLLLLFSGGVAAEHAGFTPWLGLSSRDLQGADQALYHAENDPNPDKRSLALNALKIHFERTTKVLSQATGDAGVLGKDALNRLKDRALISIGALAGLAGKPGKIGSQARLYLKTIEDHIKNL